MGPPPLRMGICTTYLINWNIFARKQKPNCSKKVRNSTNSMKIKYIFNWIEDIFSLIVKMLTHLELIASFVSAPAHLFVVADFYMANCIRRTLINLRRPSSNLLAMTWTLMVNPNNLEDLYASIIPYIIIAHICSRDWMSIILLIVTWMMLVLLQCILMMKLLTQCICADCA